MQKIDAGYVEVHWGELVVFTTDLELLDQGKQAKNVHILNGIEPPKFFFVRVVVDRGKGVMEVGNSGDVPGVTGQGACAETACVVSKIGGDHSEDIQGKADGRGIVCCRGLWQNIP